MTVDSTVDLIFGTSQLVRSLEDEALGEPGYGVKSAAGPGEMITAFDVQGFCCFCTNLLTGKFQGHDSN